MRPSRPWFGIAMIRPASRAGPPAGRTASGPRRMWRVQRAHWPAAPRAAAPRTTAATRMYRTVARAGLARARARGQARPG